MDDEATLFHDHSTAEGRFSLFLHRMKWRYLIPPAVFLAAFGGIAILIVTITAEPGLRSSSSAAKGLLKQIPGNSLLGENDPNLLKAAATTTATEDGDNDAEEVAGWTVIKQPRPGVVEAEGCENGLYTFEGFDSSVPTATATTLRVRNLVLDAPQFSQSLEDWTSLENIVIENVWVNGNFSRVYLPNLKKFIFHQFRNGKTDLHKLPDVLKQTLFFDKDPVKTWDLNRDLLDLNMTIQVTVEGTKILDVEPDFGEININTHTCEDIYKNFHTNETFPLSTLSLNWCPVGNATLKKLKESGDTLEFLFLNNAVPSSTQELEEMTDSLGKLKELHLFQRFHCDWPGYEIYLNVSSLSPSVETLSVTNLDLSWDPVGVNSIRNLSLDQYVGDNVVNNFPSIFPNLHSLALFNVTQNRSYPLLEKVLFQAKPELVIVTELTRLKLKKDSKSNNGEKESSQKSKENGINDLQSNNKQTKKPSSSLFLLATKVEELLQSAGVPNTASSFKLELCKENGTYSGMELTRFERNLQRFNRLAFRKIDTYADYVTWDAEPK